MLVAASFACLAPSCPAKNGNGAADGGATPDGGGSEVDSGTSPDMLFSDFDYPMTIPGLCMWFNPVQLQAGPIDPRCTGTPTTTSSRWW